MDQEQQRTAIDNLRSVKIMHSETVIITRPSLSIVT